MPDNKFDKDIDRMATLHDAKIRIIDLMQNGFELPDTGIYDEPVRYFKANLKWTPIIFGWLTWLEDVAAWPDAEDANYRGIEEIMTFEEGIDIAMATQEDIAKGMYQAFNWLALQVATGQYANINLSTDEDGVVTLPTGDETDNLPEDDPATTIDESLAAQAGGAIAVRLGFNDIWAICSADWLAGKTSLQCAAKLQDLYQWVDPLLVVDFTNDYFAARTGALSFIAAFTTVLDGKLFCRGNNKYTLSDWIYETYTNVEQLESALLLMEAIAQEQMNDWFAYGQKTPSTAYIAYSCTRAKTEEFILDMSLSNFPQYTTNAIYKPGHRILIEVSGSFVDADVANTLQDFYYEVNTITNAKLYLPGFFQISHPGITEPGQILVPYESSHVYATTIDIATGVAAAAIIFGRDNDSATIPNVSGILTFKITDLGEYAL